VSFSLCTVELTAFDVLSKGELSKRTP
jgi:hypothetical protein